MTPPLYCFVCDKELENLARPSEVQPNDGLTFQAAGNYGSTLFDPYQSNSYLVIAICDGCVTDRLNRLFVKNTERQRPIVTFRQPANVEDLPE